MTDKYTPTTEEVTSLAQALHASESVDYGVDPYEPGGFHDLQARALLQSDWLAAHDAEQQRIGAERAWDEGYSTGYPDGYTSAKYADDENPYRKDAS